MLDKIKKLFDESLKDKISQIENLNENKEEYNYGYDGEYKYGRPNGYGKYSFPDGRKYVGEFKDGYPWTGIVYNKEGEVVNEYFKGLPK